MYHLVTYKNGYNIYCDTVHDTTGFNVTVPDCIAASTYIGNCKNWKSLDNFCTRHKAEILCSFSSIEDLPTIYPEYFI